MAARLRIALLSTAAAALLLLYLLSGGSDDGGEAAGGGQILLPELRPAAVNAVRLRYNPEGDEQLRYRFFRSAGGQGWELRRNGAALPAREGRVEALLRELAGLETAGRAAEGRESWNRLGVGSGAALRVIIRFGGEKDGEREIRLFLGGRIPGTEQCYVRRGDDDAVFTTPVPSFLGREELKYWAEVQVYLGRRRPGEVISLQIASFRGDRIRVLRSGSEEHWLLHIGEQGKPQVIEEGERVEQFLRHLFSLRADDVAAGCGDDRDAIITIRTELEDGTVLLLEIYDRGPEREYLLCRGNEEAAGYVVRERKIGVLQDSLRRLLESPDEGGE